MTKQETLAKLHEIGLVAVLRGPSLELTLQMVGALIAGGVQAVEITYSTPYAAEVTQQLDKKYGSTIVLGMGTLTEPKQVADAREAGAKFIVSPICTQDLGKAMVSSGLAVMIGALSPTEIYEAYQMGSDVVKVFPGSLVGPAYIKAIKGPFPSIPIMPTGGVSAANVGEWFSAGVFGVGAGSELCPPTLAREGKFEEITLRAREFVAAVKQAQKKVPGK